MSIRVTFSAEPYEVPELTQTEHGTPIPVKTFDRYQAARKEFDEALAELEIALAANVEIE